FFFHSKATTDPYTVGTTLSLHAALPICIGWSHVAPDAWHGDRIPPGMMWDRSEEHTSELQSLPTISYAVYRLKKKKTREPYTARASSSCRTTARRCANTS